MITHRKILALALGGLLIAVPAHAQGLADQIVVQMTGQGFRNIAIEATWLGRTRITGTRKGETREIVVNPNTGEILRDLWLNEKGQVKAADIDLVADDGQDGPVGSTNSDVDKPSDGTSSDDGTKTNGSDDGSDTNGSESATDSKGSESGSDSKGSESGSDSKGSESGSESGDKGRGDDRESGDGKSDSGRNSSGDSKSGDRNGD